MQRRRRRHTQTRPGHSTGRSAQRCCRCRPQFRHPPRRVPSRPGLRRRTRCRRRSVRPRSSRLPWSRCSSGWRRRCRSRTDSRPGWPQTVRPPAATRCAVPARLPGSRTDYSVPLMPDPPSGGRQPLPSAAQRRASPCLRSFVPSHVLRLASCGPSPLPRMCRSSPPPRLLREVHQGWTNGRPPTGSETDERPTRRAAYAGASGSSSAYLPFASSVPASGYSPLKHASQCVSRETPTAS